VNSYGIGFVSVRKPDETWEQAEQRVYHMKRKDFPATALVESVSLNLLDPAVRPQYEQMLKDAKAAGFSVEVVATYRSPQREALLMSEGRARTHTLTSTHSYGRAIASRSAAATSAGRKLASHGRRSDAGSSRTISISFASLAHPTTHGTGGTSRYPATRSAIARSTLPWPPQESARCESRSIGVYVHGEHPRRVDGSRSTLA